MSSTDENRPPDAAEQPDTEANRFSRRMRRYAQVSTGMSGTAARLAGNALFGMSLDRDKNAQQLAKALGGMKGPIMKVAQLLSTIPDALPPEYAAELSQLQSQAPPMGWPFVKRRMAAELGPDWQSRFAEFSREAVASASLGQVHKARTHDGETLACKLQYPDMQSYVQADLNQFRWLLRIHKQMDPAIDTSEIAAELEARLYEELDYDLEARHTTLYGHIFEGDDLIEVPAVYKSLSTKRLLSLSWMDGQPLVNYKTHSQEDRNQIAPRAIPRLVAPIQPLRRDPRRPASGQLHDLRERRAPRRHQLAGLRLYPHLRAALRGGSHQPLSRAGAR